MDVKEAERRAELEQQQRVHAEKAAAEMYHSDHQMRHHKHRHYVDEADDIPLGEGEPVSYMSKRDKKRH